MNKYDLIDTLRKETNLTKSKSEQVVELFFYEMPNALANGYRMEIRSFCSILRRYLARLTKFWPSLTRYVRWPNCICNVSTGCSSGEATTILLPWKGP